MNSPPILRTYFSGDWDVHWGYDLGFDPWPYFCSSPIPIVPFYPFLGEGSHTKIDYRKQGTLILTSLLEDLALRTSTALLLRKAGAVGAGQAHPVGRGGGSPGRALRH